MQSSKEFSKEMHFIWVGGPIPENYLRNILEVANIAKRSGFKVNIWVDNEKNYFQTFNKIKTNISTTYLEADDEQINKVLGINIKNISELKSRMYGSNADAFYKKNDPDFFWKCVTREMIGSKNLAAAADFLRYEILRQLGGFYIDADNTFPEIHFSAQDPDYIEKFQRKYTTLQFDSQKTDYGIQVNFKFDYSNLPKQMTGNNDVIAITADHPVMEKTLECCFTNYRELDNTKNEWEENKDFPQNYMDMKRFPFSRKKIFNPRKEFTIDASGPGALKNALISYINEENICTEDALNSLLLQETEDFYPLSKIAGLTIISNCDKTWLNQKKKTAASFTTEDLPNNRLDKNKQPKM